MGWLKKAVKAVVGGVTDVVKGAVNVAANVVGAVGDVVQAGVDVVSGAVKEVGKAVTRTAKSVVKTVEKTVNQVSKAVESIGQMIQPLVERYAIQLALMYVGIPPNIAAPMSAGMHTISRGGSPEDAIKSAAVVTVAQNVQSSVYNSAVKAGYTTAQASAAASAASSAVTTAAAGGDISTVLKASAIGGISGGAGTTVLQETKNLALANFTSSAISSALQGQQLKEAILNGASAATVSYIQQIQSEQKRGTDVVAERDRGYDEYVKAVNDYNSTLEKYNAATTQQEVDSLQQQLDTKLADINRRVDLLGRQNQQIADQQAKLNELTKKAEAETGQSLADFTEDITVKVAAQEQDVLGQLKQVQALAEISDEFGKFASQEGVDVAALPAAAAAAGTQAAGAFGRAAIQAAPSIAVKLSRFAANDPRFAQMLAENSYVKEILSYAGVQAVVNAEGVLEVRPIVTENQSAAETNRLANYAKKINEQLPTRSQPVINELNNQIQKSEELIQFEAPVNVPAPAPEVAPEQLYEEFNFTSPDVQTLQNQINQSAQQAQDTTTNLQELFLNQRLFAEQLQVARKDRERLNSNREAAIRARDAAPTPVARDEATTIIDRLDEAIRRNDEITRNIETNTETVTGDIAAADETLRQLEESIAAAQRNLEEIRVGREERVGRATEERYRREMEQFDRELERLEQDLSKAESEAATSKLRQGFVESQRERLRRSERLPGTLEEQINTELDDILRSYERSKALATRAATQTERIGAAQQAAGGARERRDVRDEDVIRLLRLDLPEAQRFGFLPAGGELPTGEPTLAPIPEEPPEEAPPPEEGGVQPGEEGAVDAQGRPIFKTVTIGERRAGEAAQSISPRVTGEALAGILGEKEPLFGGDEDEQRAVWNRRSLRLRRALGL